MHAHRRVSKHDVKSGAPPNPCETRDELRRLRGRAHRNAFDQTMEPSVRDCGVDAKEVIMVRVKTESYSEILYVASKRACEVFSVGSINVAMQSRREFEVEN